MSFPKKNTIAAEVPYGPAVDEDIQDNAKDARSDLFDSRNLHNYKAGKAAGPGAIRAMGQDPSKTPPGFPKSLFADWSGFGANGDGDDGR